MDLWKFSTNCAHYDDDLTEPIGLVSIVRMLKKFGDEKFSFDQLVDSLLMKMKHNLEQSMSISHSLIFENNISRWLLVFRKILSLMFGFFIGNLVLSVFEPKDSDPEWHRLFFKMALILSAIIFCQSIQFRAVLCLVIPTLIINLSGLFCYSFLIADLFHIILPSLLSNLHSLITMIICMLYYG